MPIYKFNYIFFQAIQLFIYVLIYEISQLFQPLRFIIDASQFLLKYNVLQAINFMSERLFLVLFIEEFSIRESRSENSFISMSYNVLVCACAAAASRTRTKMATSS